MKRFFFFFLVKIQHTKQNNHLSTASKTSVCHQRRFELIIEPETVIDKVGINLNEDKLVSDTQNQFFLALFGITNFVLRNG